MASKRPAARKIHESVTQERVIEAVQDDSNTGFCLACGDEVDGVEPDARAYKCYACGALRVYGAEEVLFML